MGRGEYLGEFEQVVLLAVARLGQDAYGMRIRREIENRTGRAVSIGAVYATLERLADKGCLRVRAGGDGRPRRFFAVTDTGVDGLETSRDIHTRMWAGLRLQKSRQRS